MILNKGECILFENPDDFVKAWDILNQEGYCMWGGTKLGMSLPRYRRGLRWCVDYDFPKCLATMDSPMVRKARLYGVVDDRSKGNNPYIVVEAEEFFARLKNRYTAVDDLL